MVTLERTQAVPLSMRDDGTIHVAGSRVTLDTIIGRHKRGDTPEEIHDGFPTLTLAQIYGVLHYYHQHAEQVDEYLAQRKAEARRLRRKMEGALGTDNVRARLRARRAAMTTATDANHGPSPG